MTRSTARLLAGTLPFLLAACDEEAAPTGVAAPEAGTDLAFVMPSLRPGDLVSHAELDGVPPHAVGLDGPSRVDEGGEDFDEEEVAKVLDPRTNVGFFDSGAYSEGFHRLQGHGARVETTARVSFDGRALGEQTAVAQRSWWLSLDVTHFIGALARVYSEATCGLSVQGSSTHSAWLELFSGRAAPEWARDIATTQRGPVAQTPCGRVILTRDPTGQHEQQAGFTCLYLITYDLDTGEILRAELLQCSTNDGPLI